MWIAGGLGKNNVSEMVGELLECIKKQKRCGKVEIPKTKNPFKIFCWEGKRNMGYKLKKTKG